MNYDYFEKKKVANFDYLRVRTEFENLILKCKSQTAFRHQYAHQLRSEFGKADLNNFLLEPYTARRLP